MKKENQMSEDSKIEKPTEQNYDMEALRSKADLMGIEYHPSIGGKKLKEKIDLHVAEIANPGDEEEFENVHSVGPSKSIAGIEKAARKTRRVIIIDNDVRDQSNPTIPLTVGNSYFKVGGLIKKEVEQDVPQILIDELLGKSMVRFVNAIDNITKRPTGNKIPQTIKRYNIQFLD